MKDPYKAKVIKGELEKMKNDEFYLVRLKGGTGKAINLDEDALKLLIEHYEGR